QIDEPCKNMSVTQIDAEPKKVAKHLSLSPSVDNILAISNLLFRDGDRRFRNRAETAQKKRFLKSRQR
ncbi:MAG: hypothetical protein ACI3ZB_10535, partial [Prevotella sp.]